MRHLLVASAFAASLLAVPALSATPDAPAPRPQRAVTAAGVTKPTPTAPRATKASTDAALLKAQKASAARDKAWDARTRASMGSICKGC